MKRRYIVTFSEKRSKDLKKAFTCFILASGEDCYFYPQGASMYENEENDQDDCEGTAQYYGGILMQGICLFEGFGVEQNYQRGFSLIAEAEYEINDNRIVWRYLGMAFLDGKGTKQDEDKAVEYFKQAAGYRTGGDAISQYYLAFCYEHGRGVEQDTAAAKEWYRKAAAQGNEEARLKLAGEKE